MTTEGSLHGQVAIITGSGRGIGAACALELGARGASVVVNYRRDAQAAEGVRQEILDAGGQAIVVQADVATPEGADALADAARRAYGRVDILVCNAGPLFGPTPLTDLTWEILGDIVMKDVQCAFFITEAVLPTMIEQERGRIVFIGSVASRRPTRGLTHHATGRAAVTAFAQSVAVEMGPHGITANVVAPGMVLTDRTAAAGPMTARLAAITPVGRLATPQDVARAVAFFAADAEGFYTGAVLPIDGGLTS